MQRGAGARTTALEASVPVVPISVFGVGSRILSIGATRFLSGEKRGRPRSMTLTNVAVFECGESRIGNRTPPYRVRPAPQELLRGRRASRIQSSTSRPLRNSRTLRTEANEGLEGGHGTTTPSQKQKISTFDSSTSPTGKSSPTLSIRSQRNGHLW